MLGLNFVQGSFRAGIVYDFKYIKHIDDKKNTRKRIAKY